MDHPVTALDQLGGRAGCQLHDVTTLGGVPLAGSKAQPFVIRTLVTQVELDRNPTVKEEIQAAGAKQINAGMYTYRR